ncbi:hypothetical protein EDS67_11195 [candidate division KSB1 bacterium]|nr:MAG: hypothetical protein EDS67_11195 [candidate division KSB1 bacterium]MCE7942043.1 hypothetical protein [Chlorobi bacterium CHB1]MDL1878683.1 hypothetical protein [Cytophagia bacterium CHB2]
MRLNRFICPTLLSIYISAACEFAVAGASTDSLDLRVYKNANAFSSDSLPPVFPRHRPFKLLIHARGNFNVNLSALQLADTLAAVHKLAGLQYYSRTEKKTKTLFKASAVVPFPASNRTSPSPAFRALPIDTSFYFFQIDNRLGKVAYRADLRAEKNHVTFFVYNVSPVSKWGLQIAEIGDFLVFIELQRHEDEWRFDGWQWTHPKGGLLGILVHEDSLVHRFRAVAGFYLDAMKQRR